jgi:transposase InsO family protein
LLPIIIDGRRLRILVVVDDCTRECLALIADTSISGIRVTRELDRLLDARGKPKTIVSDNGTELTSNAILQWAQLDEPSDLRCGTTLRPAALHRRLRSADRRHHRPTGRH